MIPIGASTANFYPLPTEEALEALLILGFKTIEVFLNTESETDPAFLRHLKAMADRFEARIVSLHPYTSVAEPYLFFTEYPRRFADGCRLYDRLFAAAQQLGAGLLIMHGDRAAGNLLPVEESIKRFETLYDQGQSHGVRLVLENVCRNRSSDPLYLEAMRNALGDKAGFVLDCKQVLRSHVTLEQVWHAMGNRIAHVHISDHTPLHDCLVPGQGQMDYRSFFRELIQRGFRGAVIIELYKNAFESPSDLWNGYKILQNYLLESPNSSFQPMFFKKHLDND